MRNKKEIRELVAGGYLQQAAQSAMEYAEASTDMDTLNGLIAIHSDLQNFQNLWNANLISFEEFSRTQARATNDLLGRIDELPDEPSPVSKKTRVQDVHLKWLIFYLFISAKLILIGWTLFMWETKGFLNSEVFSLFNAMLPGLVLNVSIMFRELFRSGIDGYSKRRYVPPQLRALAWVIFPSYIAVQIFITIAKMKGDFSFEIASTAFMAVETGLGLYMGEIVEGLFKKKDIS